MSEEPLRVLQMLPGSGVLGGIETFVMSYFENIDRDKVQFDFVFHYEEPSPIEERVQDLGGRIFRFSVREDMNISAYKKGLRRLFAEHPEYQIVHGHMPGLAPIYFHVAKQAGIQRRIAHSHVTATEPTLKGAVLRNTMKLIKYEANEYCACSKLAGDFLFPGRQVTLVKNAIDAGRFQYSRESRCSMRAKLGIDDTEVVIGHVGRFSPQKNHQFLVKVFREYVRRNPKSRLLLCGDGPLEDNTRELVHAYGLEDKVMFLGRRLDVDQLYQAMDVFLLPSLFEGLAIVLIEAQASGLPCVTSTETSVESNITGNVAFADLGSPTDRWADAIEEALSIPRVDQIDNIKAAGYDIVTASKRLQNYYLYGVM